MPTVASLNFSFWLPFVLPHIRVSATGSLGFRFHPCVLFGHVEYRHSRNIKLARKVGMFLGQCLPPVITRLPLPPNMILHAHHRWKPAWPKTWSFHPVNVSGHTYVCAFSLANRTKKTERVLLGSTRHFQISTTFLRRAFRRLLASPYSLRWIEHLPYSKCIWSIVSIYEEDWGLVCQYGTDEPLGQLIPYGFVCVGETIEQVAYQRHESRAQNRVIFSLWRDANCKGERASGKFS